MNRLIYNTTSFGGRQKPGKFYTPEAATAIYETEIHDYIPVKQNPVKQNPVKQNPVKQNPVKQNPVKQN